MLSIKNTMLQHLLESARLCFQQSSFPDFQYFNKSNAIILWNGQKPNLPILAQTRLPIYLCNAAHDPQASGRR